MIPLCEEMIDFGKSDEMIKINGKVDKSKTYNRFNRNISFFIPGSRLFEYEHWRETIDFGRGCLICMLSG